MLLQIRPERRAAFLEEVAHLVRRAKMKVMQGRKGDATPPLPGNRALPKLRVVRSSLEKVEKIVLVAAPFLIVFFYLLGAGIVHKQRAGELSKKYRVPNITGKRL
jgi:hypothetical protein